MQLKKIIVVVIVVQNKEEYKSQTQQRKNNNNHFLRLKVLNMSMPCQEYLSIINSVYKIKLNHQN